MRSTAASSAGAGISRRRSTCTSLIRRWSRRRFAGGARPHHRTNGAARAAYDELVRPHRTGRVDAPRRRRGLVRDHIHPIRRNARRGASRARRRRHATGATADAGRCARPAAASASSGTHHAARARGAAARAAARTAAGRACTSPRAGAGSWPRSPLGDTHRRGRIRRRCGCSRLSDPRAAREQQTLPLPTA